MFVDYTLETSDFIAFAEEQRRLTSNSLSRLYYWGIIPALGVGLAVASQSFTVAMIFTLLYMLSGWLMHHWIQQKYRLVAYSEENLPLSSRRWRATLTDEGMSFTSDAAVILYRWHFIREVFRGQRYVHIGITRLRRGHIPVRAFSDEDQVQQFIDKAQFYIKKHAGQ